MSSYQLKIYHIENKVTKEIRKFTADSDIATNYEYLSAKIRTTFPDLVNKNIELFWIGTYFSHFFFLTEVSKFCGFKK